MSKKIRLGYDILSKRAIETESGVNIDDALRSISSYQKVPGVGIDNHPDVPRPSTKILYIVKVASAGQPDTYKEWIWTQPSDGQGYWECTGDTSQDLSVYALKSEMSVVPGTGADADKTTITLKEGASATVLTSHQGLGDYVSVNPQSFTSDEKAAARANIGAAEDTAVQKIMIGEGQASKSGTTVTIPMAATGVAGAMSGGDKDKLDGIAQGAQVNVQSSWTETDTTSDAYIQGKPANLVQDANYNHTDNNYTDADKTKLDSIDMSTKADKVASATSGDLATLDAYGNLADSGVASTVLTSKAGASGGTELSLVTTGEKYTWNSWVDATYQIPIEPVIIGGRAYNVVTIGNQQWMAENLDYKYTGLTICNTSNPMTNTVIDSDAATENIIKGATYYDYDETTYGINGNRYGLLYNWPAVEYLENNKNALGIPTGWRVPTETDFKTLRTNAGGFTDSRIKLASLSGWSNGNNGTDDYGFNGVPAGYGIGYQDIFNNITNMTSYWSISPDSTDSDYTVYANLGLNNNYLDTQTDRRYVFNSVRLVRDIT